MERKEFTTACCEFIHLRAVIASVTQCYAGAPELLSSVLSTLIALPHPCPSTSTPHHAAVRRRHAACCAGAAGVCAAARRIPVRLPHADKLCSPGHLGACALQCIPLRCPRIGSTQLCVLARQAVASALALPPCRKSYLHGPHTLTNRAPHPWLHQRCQTNRCSTPYSPWQCHKVSAACIPVC